MVLVPEEPRYSQDHEWVLTSGVGIVRVGITDYAQGELGDIVFVEFPRVGDVVARQEPVGTVESTKSVSEVFAPVAGEVLACNDALVASPELINSDPYGEGWMMEIRLTDASEMDSLLSAEAYRRLVSSEEN